MKDLRLDTNFVDYAILATYFLVVLGVGFAAKRYIKSSLDYFLSGRSLPAWITGLAFISANLGALEVIGMSANGAQYGVATVNYYWIGAIPAMVFLGLVMMPFYYGSKIRSVPEYLRLRFNDPAHKFNSSTFALATVLIAGVNLYALALVLELLLGWPLLVGIVVAGVIVMVYISLGGLSSAIYNEVLQFFVIIAALLPIVIVGLVDVGGWNGLMDGIKESNLGEAGLHALEGTSARQRDEPDRLELDRPRVRPRLRALVRLLDDELRRGPARAVGQGPVGRPAHAADRRVPEARPAVHHDRAGHDRAGRDPEHGQRRRPEPRVQQRAAAADERVPAERHARAGDHRPDGVVHGRRGGERVGVQHGRHDRPDRAVHPARASPTSGTCASAASRRSAASSWRWAPR